MKFLTLVVLLFGINAYAQQESELCTVFSTNISNDQSHGTALGTICTNSALTQLTIAFAKDKVTKGTSYNGEEYSYYSEDEAELARAHMQVIKYLMKNGYSKNLNGKYSNIFVK